MMLHTIGYKVFEFDGKFVKKTTAILREESTATFDDLVEKIELKHRGYQVQVVSWAVRKTQA